ncbi:MAG: NADH-quinone oxidoreductase subunit NuoK [Planctomycetales bacterium]|nr:NADH-quinone oxidoreductase subunit NuoK [Planctomycetales bacterium]
MNEVALLQNYLLIGGLLFGIGLTGFLVRRNMIVVFLSAEMMLQGVSLSLVAWSRYHMDWGGQLMVIFIIAVAACEAAIALALVLMLHRQSDTLDLAFWHDTREDGTPPHVDRQIPEEAAPERVWPTLTPAGIEPAPEPERELYRPRV